MPPNARNSTIVLVTGPSGAGRSTAINAFEDLDFETIDNMPLSLIPAVIRGEPVERPIALGIDVRTRDFSVKGVLDVKDVIDASPTYEPSLMFLDADTDTLLRRYSETRRRHPMAPADSPQRGIEAERDLLANLRLRADILIDTTKLTPHDLKAEVGRLFGSTDAQGMAVTVQSFSYKRGIPRGIDMVFDCRFLNNPYWDENLRELSGLDPEVAAYVARDHRFDAFFSQVKNLMVTLLPAYKDEGKAHFTVGFGCSGGQHRSVAIAEALKEVLAAEGWHTSVRHREMERRDSAETGRSDPR